MAYCEVSPDNGATYFPLLAGATFKDLNAVTVTTIATLWTPATGKKVLLLGGTISLSAATNLLLEDNAAHADNFIFRTPKLLADTPYTLPYFGGRGRLLSAVDRVLKGTSGAAATVTGTLFGQEV